MYLKYILLKSWTLTRNCQTTITSALNSHKNVPFKPSVHNVVSRGTNIAELKMAFLYF